MRAISSSCMISLIFCGTLIAAERYNFRTSAAYRALKSEEREKLEQVHRDFVLLWGALDMYAEDHEGQVPDELSELSPSYLKELPRDPFATTTAAKKELGQYKPSLGGFGYRYRPGNGNAFILSSVGLPGFPYLPKRGNVDLYIAKGFWTGGGQKVR